MSKEIVVEFPKKSVIVNRQTCKACGSGLEMWTDSDSNAYGLCHSCDFGIGDNPVRVFFDEDK